ARHHARSARRPARRARPARPPRAHAAAPVGRPGGDGGTRGRRGRAVRRRHPVSPRRSLGAEGDPRGAVLVRHVRWRAARDARPRLGRRFRPHDERGGCAPGHRGSRAPGVRVRRAPRLPGRRPRDHGIDHPRAGRRAPGHRPRADDGGCAPGRARVRRRGAPFQWHPLPPGAGDGDRGGRARGDDRHPPVRQLAVLPGLRRRPGHPSDDDGRGGDARRHQGREGRPLPRHHRGERAVPEHRHGRLRRRLRARGERGGHWRADGARDDRDRPHRLHRSAADRRRHHGNVAAVRPGRAHRQARRTPAAGDPGRAAL
ncbi:MAG: Formiminoglutamase, partial [uncultured Gemmatimonadetes bacterium]